MLIDEPVHPNPLYGLPYISLATVLMASVALGIARHALDALVDLTASKVPTRSQSLLREHAHAQTQIGQAEGLVQSGRAFAYEALGAAWAAAERGERLTWAEHGKLRLAGTQAVSQALDAVDLVFRTAGASSVYTSRPFEKCLRDIRTATQHHCVTPTNYETAGQFAMGWDPTDLFWGRDFRTP
jgi:alkylation response protein AidB-like acyl-CoA dehydrogenase